MRWEREWIARGRVDPPAPARPEVVRVEVESASEYAMRLLESHLTEYQLRDLKANMGFNVRGSMGQLYRIVRITHHASRLVAHGELVEPQPFHSDDRVSLWNNVIDSAGKARGAWPRQYEIYPEGDILLAQKLIIEGNEGWFRRNACGYSVPTSKYTRPHNYGGLI